MVKFSLSIKILSWWGFVRHLLVTVSGLAPAASKKGKPDAKYSDVHPEVNKTTAKAKQCHAEGTKLKLLLLTDCCSCPAGAIAPCYMLGIIFAGNDVRDTYD